MTEQTETVRLTPVGFYCNHSDEPNGARSHHDWEFVEGEGFVFQHHPDTISALTYPDAPYLKDGQQEQRCARAVPVYPGPDVDAELAKLRAERDKFCDRVDTLTAVAKGNKRHVQEMYLELQKAQARVAELEADLTRATRPSYSGRHVWTVWQEDQPIHAFYATEDDARQGSIDCWEETESVCPDYSWKPGPAGRLELLVGGEPGGVYISRADVFGKQAEAESTEP
ncbi:hypothetical protein [Streptomyces sp. NPDC056188]|uniref:hypothetical protein n=1 Tax=Streptomyces sp. NPDC056188 TaxID=3345740 RepID=UPI0035D6B965